MAICAAVCVAFITISPARAQEDGGEPTGLLPAESAFSVDAAFSADEETHPPLRLTPDRSEIINLDQDIERVIIGNDTNINVLMDSSRRIIVVPRAPGATHFTLLGAGGKVIMQRYAIVANPKEKYIRIRETCMSGNCQPLRMFYCPGMCHEITISDGSSSSGSNPSLNGSTAPQGQQPQQQQPAPTAGMPAL